MALRTAQGCLTSGQWFIQTELKLGAPLGRSARLGVDLRQSESDISSYEYIDFSFRFPTRVGTAGAMFRPLFDKSRQDFALMWETGLTPVVRLAGDLHLEDMFNNLWACQTRWAKLSPTCATPTKLPGCAVAATRRAQLFGQYHAPARSSGATSGRFRPRGDPCGAPCVASIEADLFGTTCELRGSNQQARGTEEPRTPGRGQRQPAAPVGGGAAGGGRSFRASAPSCADLPSRDETWPRRSGPAYSPGSTRCSSSTPAGATRAIHASVCLRPHQHREPGYSPTRPGSAAESRAYVGPRPAGRVSIEATRASSSTTRDTRSGLCTTRGSSTSRPPSRLCSPPCRLVASLGSHDYGPARSGHGRPPACRSRRVG